MLKKLGRNAEMLKGHMSRSPASTKKEREATFEVFVSMTKFLAEAVQFLREPDDVIGNTSSEGKHDFRPGLLNSPSTSCPAFRYSSRLLTRQFASRVC